MTTWTTEQRQAIDFRDQSLLVAAGAGSGKTAVLVERICTMITSGQGIDIDRLLVVTFTRAAATEMRERISHRIAEKLEETPQDEELVRQLALLNQASIMTIDSFCKKVIEENFHLVELDPDYQVMDENEQNMLIDETMAEILDEAYEAGEADFLHLADVFGGERDDAALQDMVLAIWRFSRSGTDPRAWIRTSSQAYTFDPDQWQATPWYRYLLREVREGAAEAARQARQACAVIADDPILATSKLEPFIAGEAGMLEDLLTALEATDDYDELRTRLESVTFANRPRAPKDPCAIDWVAALRDDYKKRIKALRGDLLAQDEATMQRLIRDMDGPLKSLGELTLRFYDRLQAKKLEVNRVDFADLEHFALGILRDAAGPTETARIYQQRFAEVLIDEYQDSNDVQEAILTAVSRDHRNIFMVGDVKQSIYRFRQARPEIFLGKYRRYLGLDQTADCDGRKIMLYRNFRSRPEVLDSVNAIFKAIMSERAGELDYTDEEALIFGADYDTAMKHPIEIHLVDSKSPLDSADEENEELADLRGVELEARHVAGQIRQLLADPEAMIMDRGVRRHLRPRDIVILLRATSNVAGIFKEALEEAAIAVFSDTGAGYFESIEIRTMMSLLRIVDNPRQDIPLLAVLRSPLFSFSEDELIRLRAQNRELLFLECLKLANEDLDFSSRNAALAGKAAAFLRQLDLWREESIHLPLDGFIWKIYSDTGYMEYAGAMPNGIQRQANLRILFQRAGEYEKTAFKGLYRFIRYIDAMRERSGDYGDARIMGENEDVVRIMSIHKSKGLEFPVVFLANCGKHFNRRDQGGNLILHEKLGMAVKHQDPLRGTIEDTLPRLVLKARINEEAISEEMRVLYVAMTRARERLILTGNIKDTAATVGKWFRAGAEIPCNPRKVLADSSYLDWIMPVVTNSGLLRGQFEDFDATMDRLSDGETFTLRFITRNDLLEARSAAEEDQVRPFWGGQPLADQALRAILDYEYPHAAATRLPSKVSVSVIKKQVIEEDPEVRIPDLMAETWDKAERLPRPAFLLEKRELTGSQRGTAFHNVMLHIDPLTASEAAIGQQLEAMVARELLLPEEAAAVSVSKVWGFFTSDLGQRFREAARRGQLHREEVFTRSVPARQLRPEWATDDPMTLIGIIDAFFVEGEDIILLDYKTDAVPADSTDFLKKRYQAQIDLYAGALERISGKTVREAYLYSVSRQETIRLI